MLRRVGTTMLLQLQLARCFSNSTVSVGGFTLEAASSTSTAQSGCKAIALVRHAEGIHNERAENDRENYFAGPAYTKAYWDARLTSKGEAQCAALAAQLDARWHKDEFAFDLVVVSPLMRTLQTATLSFGATRRSPPPPFVAEELWQPSNPEAS